MLEVQENSLPLGERAPELDAVLHQRGGAILIDPGGKFTRNFNRDSFQFQHELKDHPLFELPNLIELAKRPSESGAYWSNGAVGVADSWNVNRARRLTLVDTIANIGDDNSLVILKNIAQDPVYGSLLQDLFEKIGEFAGPEIRQDIVRPHASILISSPNRLTSYHMDADCNFLMQAVGNKTLWVYDHNDRTLVSHEARENFYGGNLNSISYPENPQSSAVAYELHAGEGVHMPLFAPHWGRVHDNISIAVAIMFDLRSFIDQGRIYRINRVLRKLGAAPTPPGVSPWRDRVKLAAANSYYVTREFLRRI
jgi:hypothetical protein